MIWPRDWSSDVCSSDLQRHDHHRIKELLREGLQCEHVGVVLPPDFLRDDRRGVAEDLAGGLQGDRKSTRLNSSHVAISYAVFCLKKKKKESRHKHETE